ELRDAAARLAQSREAAPAERREAPAPGPGDLLRDLGHDLRRLGDEAPAAAGASAQGPGAAEVASLRARFEALHERSLQELAATDQILQAAHVPQIILDRQARARATDSAA